MDLAQSCGMRRRGFVMYKLCDIDIFVCGAFLTLLFSLSSLAEIILWWETDGSCQCLNGFAFPFHIVQVCSCFWRVKWWSCWHFHFDALMSLFRFGISCIFFLTQIYEKCILSLLDLDKDDSSHKYTYSQAYVTLL